MEAVERAPATPRVRRAVVLAIVVVAGVLAAPIVGVAGWMGWQVVAEHAARRPFVAAEWRAVTSMYIDDEPVRQRMVDDLLERRLLDGRTRAEVEALLGPADGAFEGYDMAYALGPDRRLLGFDFEWLGIRLGPDGRVAEAKVVTRH